uniref:Uncharacterized protein n=1 Tax=Rhodnius prolixus TaxID=13249 RepID=A0ABL0DR80_RHOPR
MAISTTLFLYLHTRDLHTKLKEMEIKLQPDVSLSAQVSGESGFSAVSIMMRQLKDSGEIETLSAQSLNNTMKAEKDIVFFNRVPKVGSQTFMELLRNLAMTNDFSFHRDQVQRVETIRIPPADQLALATMINSYSTPSVYIKHVCFINFTHPFNSDSALQRAKTAVEKHYAVVGVLEDLNSTLTVLEHYIPKFFKGATKTYQEQVESYQKINRNSFKPPVSEEVKDMVRRNFTREIEFYHFCRQRLHRQLLALKLPDVYR